MDDLKKSQESIGAAAAGVLARNAIGCNRKRP
jgi:hypothetical protein